MPTAWVRVALAWIERDGAVLLTRRPEGVHQAGRWEFPGGKIEPGESLSDAIRREAQEELGVSVAVGDEMAVTRFAYPERAVELHVLRCRLIEGEPAPRQAEELCWAPVRTLSQIDFPPANAALLAALPETPHESSPPQGDPECQKG